MTGQRVAVISAAASGIGRAIAEGLIADGWRLRICDRDPAALADFRACHPDVLAVETDIADPAAVEAFAGAVRAALGPGGGIDLLVNNAGIAGPTARLEDQPVDLWRECVEVNLNGTFYLTRAMIPLLRARAPGSAIIAMSSNAGLHGCPLRGPYVASKWAVIGLVKTLAMELGPSGIRVNAVCPGSVEGPRIERVIAADARARGLSPAEVTAEYQRQSSLRTFATCNDIVEMVRFLVSPAGARISGQALAIDGHTENLSMDMAE
ncbi:MAG: SDR family oxidoreductase [Proteobacteria bacterium]|nr:SDR family oxidoreductase [Pseudomonadota bacterium]